MEDRTFSCMTQNVNGFGADEAHREEWLRAFKKEDTHGRLDMVFLQETHVEPEDVLFVTRRHAQTWGFRTGAGCAPLSFWAPSRDKKGGVAILVDPYGRIKEAQPALAEQWSPHFMAVTASQDGEKVIYVCIYAPHRKGPREAFYRDLLTLDLPGGSGS
jgi:hypothetical protein